MTREYTSAVACTTAGGRTARGTALIVVAVLAFMRAAAATDLDIWNSLVCPALKGQDGINCTESCTRGHVACSGTTITRVLLDSDSMLDGTLSSHVAALTGVTKLYLASNRFLSGTIPTEVGKMTALQIL